MPQDWTLEGGQTSWFLFQLCEMTDFKVLPVNGGWLDQPAWFLRDCLLLFEIKEWHRQIQGQPDFGVAPTKL